MLVLAHAALVGAARGRRAAEGLVLEVRAARAPEVPRDRRRGGGRALGPEVCQGVLSGVRGVLLNLEWCLNRF